MHSLFPVLILLAILPGKASPIATFDLSAPILKRSSPFQLPVKVLDGSFELDARLTLARIDSTAASIRFGDQLNFGFDSRHKTLFVEGPAAGKVTQLSPTADHLTAGKPFDIRVVRDTTNHLSILINSSKVYETDQLIGPLEHVTVRPHRATIDIHRLHLTGAITLEEKGISVSRRTIPIPADGSSHLLMDLKLVLERERTLTKVCVNPASQAGSVVLDEIQLRLRNGSTFSSITEPTSPAILTGSITLPAGTHHLQLFGSINPDSDLLKTFNPSCSWMSFKDGTKLTPPPTVLQPLRLAYFIHQRGQHKCHTFRIPGIARANNGDLLAVYDMRYNSSRDLQEHMDIGLSRSTDGGRTWSAPRPIMDMGEFGGKPENQNGCSDPNILVDRTTGEIFVSAVWTHGKPNTHQWRGTGSEPGHDIHRSSQFMMVRSKDHGLTWSTPENLTTRLKDPAWHLFAPAPGNGITLRNGTLVIPSQGRDANGLPFSNIMISKDHGKSWTVSTHARSDTTESSVAELSDGSLFLNMRDNRNRRDKSSTNGRAISTTNDLGQTWVKHPADHSALPEPTCMASTISHSLPDGRHALFFSNPHHKHSRRDITIQASLDDGRTWPHRLLLDAGTGYGYSSLVMIDAETIGILYESSQADMTFQKIPLTELLP